MAIQAGLSVYLPKLEILQLGSRWLIYFLPNHHQEHACFNSELLWHPTLRKITVCLPVVSFSVNVRAKRSMPEILSAATNVGPQADTYLAEALAQPGMILFCSMANCLCEGVIHIPCGRIQNITL